MVILYLSIMFVLIIYFAWMYDLTLKEPIIETTDLEIKTKHLKKRISDQTVKFLTDYPGGHKCI